MQLHIRGQNQHVLECQGEELISQIKVKYNCILEVNDHDTVT